MEQNLFEEFQNKKNKLKSLALKAKDFGWVYARHEFILMGASP